MTLTPTEDVKDIPQERMSECAHGADTLPPEADTARQHPAKLDTGNAGRIPQEMMAESAANKTIFDGS